MSRSTDPAPYIVAAQDPTCGRRATLIFLHGYSDDAEGLPLGLAQQFHMYNRAKHVRWVLPNAPFNPTAGTTAWFVPRQLPGGMLPFVPGTVYDSEDSDDEAGMLASVDRLDAIVAEELKTTPAERLVVGGFSQGCVTTLLWSMLGKHRLEVAGVIGVCGYFPLGGRLEALRAERGIEREDKDGRWWYYAHGSRDTIVPPKMFELGQEELFKWVDRGRVETRLFEGMGHAAGAGVLRGMLRFFDKVIPA